MAGAYPTCGPARAVHTRGMHDADDDSPDLDPRAAPGPDERDAARWEACEEGVELLHEGEIDEAIAAFEEVARLGTRVGVEGQPIRVLAPLLRWSKAEIVEAGERLGVPWALTLSCYDPVPSPEGPPRPCGHCDACQLRAKGFAEAGVRDPAQ